MPTIEVKEDGYCYLDGELVGPARLCEIKPSRPLLPERIDSPDWFTPRSLLIDWQLWCGGRLIKEFERADTNPIIVDAAPQPTERA